MSQTGELVKNPHWLVTTLDDRRVLVMILRLVAGFPHTIQAWAFLWNPMLLLSRFKASGDRQGPSSCSSALRCNPTWFHSPQVTQILTWGSGCLPSCGGFDVHIALLTFFVFIWRTLNNIISHYRWKMKNTQNIFFLCAPGWSGQMVFFVIKRKR